MLNKFNSYTKKLSKIITKINPKILKHNDLIIYLSKISIEMRINTIGQKTRPKPNSIKVVNNKNKISNFYQEILQNSARKVSKRIDGFNNNLNTLTILNVSLDYGTEGAAADNFQILVYGLHIPGDYTIKEVGDNVVITLNERYIDFDNVTINDIYVIGKFK
jgi:hypothetical protein